MQNSWTFVTDVGSYDLEIRYSNDTTRRISGSLIGGIYSHVYGEEDNVDVTRLIRRYMPVYGLWAINSSTALDCEGKKRFFFLMKCGSNFLRILIQVKILKMDLDMSVSL